jgi:hypothetical protein
VFVGCLAVGSGVFCGGYSGSWASHPGDEDGVAAQAPGMPGGAGGGRKAAADGLPILCRSTDRQVGSQTGTKGLKASVFQIRNRPYNAPQGGAGANLSGLKIRLPTHRDCGFDPHPRHQTYLTSRRPQCPYIRSALGTVWWISPILTIASFASDGILPACLG